MGLGRIFLAILCEAYNKEILEDGSERKILKLHPKLSPIKIAILPLVKKDGLKEKSYEIFEKLSEKYNCAFLETGTIGKRYRKQDEIGTPFCITFDYDSKTDNSVTIRKRDSMEQERIKIDDLEKYFSEKFN
ncbi:MAG: hypothetical protein LRZ98_00180 [Candidatus Pacebacteria bacterium]|nr:hypothetical protein [Candidatus Paceibacterota bacterium]